LGNTIDNCNNGIVGRGLHTDVRAFKMNRITQTGVTALGCRNAIVTVESNTISSRTWGVRAMFNDPCIQQQIKGNTIDINAPGTTPFSNGGIFIGEMQNPYFLSVQVNNITTIDSNSIGILVIGNNSANNNPNNISSNNVFLNRRVRANPQFRAGIALINTNTNVNCNTVNANSNNAGISGVIGIYGAEIMGAFECNSVDNTHTGIRFDGKNNIQLKGTTFNSHTNGLWLASPDAEIGLQPYQGNIWFLPALNSGFQALNSAIPLNVPASQFTVGNSALMPSPIFPPVGWFSNMSGTDTLCAFITCNRSLRLLAVDSRDSAIANNPAYSAELFKSKRQLYKKLRNAPAVLSTNTLMSNFYQQEEINAIGQLEEVQNQYATALTADVMAANQQDIHWLIYESCRDSLTQLDSLLAQNPQDTMLLQQRETTADNLANLVAAHAQFCTAQQQQCQQRLSTAMSVNQAITPILDAEAAEKEVQAIYTQTLAVGNMGYNQTQRATLALIAAMCPDEIGGSVYQARTMLSLVQDVNILEKNNCQTPEAKIVQSVAVEEQSDAFTLYPNPAEANVSLSSLEPMPAGTILEIVNPLGQTLIRHYCEDATNTVSFDISQWSAGAYFMHIRTTNNVVSKAFIITKP
jgi:hypothetical protein